MSMVRRVAMQVTCAGEAWYKGTRACAFSWARALAWAIADQEWVEGLAFGASLGWCRPVGPAWESRLASRPSVGHVQCWA